MASAPPSPAHRERRPNVNGLVGTCFSSVGVVGFLVTVATIFSLGRQTAPGDGTPDPLAVQVGGLFTYLSQVITGVVGLLVFGFFSAVGLIVSLLGLAQEPRQAALAGVALGAVGLLIGLALIVWRMSVWGFFS